MKFSHIGEGACSEGVPIYQGQAPRRVLLYHFYVSRIVASEEHHSLGRQASSSAICRQPTRGCIALQIPESTQDLPAYMERSWQYPMGNLVTSPDSRRVAVVSKNIMQISVSPDTHAARGRNCLLGFCTPRQLFVRHGPDGALPTPRAYDPKLAT